MDQIKRTDIRDIYFHARACARKACSTGLLVVLVASSAFATDRPRRSAKPSLTEKSYTGQLTATEALKPGRATDKQIAHLRSKESRADVRYRLNQALGQVETGEAVKELIASLKTDPSPMVRQGAGLQLGSFTQDPAVVEALLIALDKDADASVRRSCAHALTHSDIPVVTTALGRAANSADPLMRRQIAFSLKRHTNKAAQRILKTLAKDSDASVRRMAGAKK